MEGKWLFIPLEQQEQITNWFEQYYYNPDAEMEDISLAMQDAGIIKILEELILERGIMYVEPRSRNNRFK